MKKYLDIRIEALSDEDIQDMLGALRKIQYCGELGTNARLPLQIDGDGSGQITFQIHEQEVKNPKLKNLNNMEVSKRGVREMYGGSDFSTHYIGE